ncbi:MAG: DUF4252 domain-containing protein [Saprospiraceae bacterium]|nr:DUF4252 domain-containing protein [Saprospiraceae bacterium]
MKQILFCLLICLLSAAGLQAQDRGLYWKYKDYDGAISLTLPQWIIHAGSWFLEEKTDRQMLRKVRKVRVLVFEDEPGPVTKKDIDRFNRKAERRRLDHMLSLREQQTRVEIWAKERRNALRKVVILVREPDSFAFVSLRGKIRMEDLVKLLQDMPRDSKDGKEENRLIPANVREVIRI